MNGLVFPFGLYCADDGGQGTAPRPDPAVLGGKGAALAEISAIGLPVPPGFTISADICAQFLAEDNFPDGLKGAVREALAGVEQATGRIFGDAGNPLLVSVRSGARASMPGMMDTVLNLGLNDQTVEGLASASGDARFAWDSYRRFIQIYADVVLGVDRDLFEDALEIVKENSAIFSETDLDYEHFQQLTADYLQIVRDETGEPFPQQVDAQLWGAIKAVCHSWNSARSCTYRQLHAIPDHWGTAVTVQAMVFGNRSADSATGVAFTRDPKTGEACLFGEYLPNAQGEDVVSGMRMPAYITRAMREAAGAREPSMEETMPAAFAELKGLAQKLEAHFCDMQDIEFTVEQGRLWLLQTRPGRRAVKAALKIAVDMVNEGLIDQATAIGRIDPLTLDQLLHPVLDPNAPRDMLARGLPASPGAASGVIVLDADEAERRAELGEAVILVRGETSPEDIGGIYAARGILTARGGMTSHAAVVARGMGRVCVSGAPGLFIDLKRRCIKIGARELAEGEIITLDGTRGEVLVGKVPAIEPELSGDFATIMEWADGFRRLRVRANAETPEDCRLARQFGAEGVGLCRTEHMFFDAARISVVRRMVLAENPEQRQEALALLLPRQRDDFARIFTEIAGQPIAVRLLDPPLHEFMPRGDADYAELSDAIGVGVDRLKRRVAQLQEANPALGHRGCRLAIVFPEIYEMQARAVFEAVCDQVLAGDTPVLPELLIPFISSKSEMAVLRERLDAVAAQVFDEKGCEVPYRIGAMIELPRAALEARDIAQHADFFSFGTNDLTQTSLGLSRDDAGHFLGRYAELGIYRNDPFITLDQEGVGELIKIAVERGCETKPGLPLGVCGEHAGDPASIVFFENMGFDYISAPPYRIPIARLAAAQAVHAWQENMAD